MASRYAQRPRAPSPPRSPTFGRASTAISGDNFNILRRQQQVSANSFYWRLYTKSLIVLQLELDFFSTVKLFSFFGLVANNVFTEMTLGRQKIKRCTSTSAGTKTYNVDKISTVDRGQLRHRQHVQRRSRWPGKIIVDLSVFSVQEYNKPFNLAYKNQTKNNIIRHSK